MLNNCLQCPYINCGRIPPQKPFNSDIVIVGMAPGSDELKKQTPFVGRSGKLLRETLDVSGFTQIPYITNALLCKPLNENNVSKDAIKLCRERVVEEVKSAQPKFIIALGNIALASLQNTNKLKIGSVHSVPLKWVEDENVTIIPIYHPAKILRNAGEYQTFLNAFIYANKLYKGEKVKDPGETKWTVVESIDQAKQIEKDIFDNDVISCDVETVGLNPKTAKLLCIGFGIEKNKAIVFPWEEQFIPYIKSIIENSRAKFVYHRSQFDTAVLWWHGINAIADEDTILQHYALNENVGNHDLKILSIRYLGAKDYDSIINKLSKNKTRMDLVPKELLYEYLAKDCDYTLQLYNIFKNQVDNNLYANKLYRHILIPAVNFLRRMSITGFMVNKQYLSKYKIELKRDLTKLEFEISNIVGNLYNREQYMQDSKAKSAPEHFNTRSPDQKRWLLFTQMELRPNIRKITKTGKLSVDVEVLESIEDGGEILKLILRHSKLTKIYSTYVVGIENKLDDDLRLRASFNPQATVTGRLSSSKPNMQNIPRDDKVKNIFVASEGKTLIEADYKGLELRILAHFSQDPFLIKCFQDGRDLHDEMSIAIFGPNFTKEQRVAVKGVNFGIAYGREAYSIAQEFGISVKDAQRIIDDWFAKAPKAKEYMDWCIAHLHSKKPFVTPFYRQRRYGIVTGDKHQENEARNFAIQSTGSDLTLMSALKMENKLLSLSAFITNLVHDAIISECIEDKNIVEKVANIIISTMEEIPKIWLNPVIPFPVEVSIGNVWGKKSMIPLEDYLKGIDK